MEETGASLLGGLEEMGAAPVRKMQGESFEHRGQQI
jgi:hypothetical protein